MQIFRKSPARYLLLMMLREKNCVPTESFSKLINQELNNIIPFLNALLD